MNNRTQIAARLFALVTICLSASTAAAQSLPSTSAPLPPAVTTLPAELLGNTGILANGSVHPHGAYTTYHFEYGPTPDYGQRTESRPLPPRLAAYYRERWDDDAGGWFSWGQGGLRHHATGGAAGGFVRFQEPSGDDHNHDDAVGTVHLSKYVYTGIWGPISGKPSLFLAAGSPDLRDARIKIHVRGTDWVPNGTELMWWAQSQSNIELRDQPGWQHSNWAYTGFSLADRLASGAWQGVEYRLHNNGLDWSYAGDNPRTRGRYTYWPLDTMLSHMNLDCFHMVMFVDPANPPTGAIDFDEFELAYRNHSLVLPSNGGRLVSAPESPESPDTLTDGWRNGQGHAWHSAEQSKSAPSRGPLEFVYAFENPVTIRAVQLHQNPDWPAKDVEVLASRDGRAFETLTTCTLPERGEPNANFAFALADGLEAQATRMKVRITSGYRDTAWGLGEIEVFGDGAKMLPDDDLYHVNADLTGLTPGTAYHVRLVAESATGMVAGEDQVIALPADLRPHVTTGAAGLVTATTAQLQGRLNPLGSSTQYHFEYGPDQQFGQRTPSTYGGLQITPRLAFANITDLKPATTYHVRLVAENEHGASTGADAMFTTAAE
jgi:hypothetical protein